MITGTELAQIVDDFTQAKNNKYIEEKIKPFVDSLEENFINAAKIGHNYCTIPRNPNSLNSGAFEDGLKMYCERIGLTVDSNTREHIFKWPRKPTLTPKPVVSIKDAPAGDTP